MSDAFVVMPRGIGTLLEGMMIWQLLQVGHLQNTPLILVGKMYGELVAWCRDHMLRPDIQLANAEDIALPHCVEDGPGVVRIVRESQAAWMAARKL
jgi:predicted Rossmann-fold nucleotide-binding protein